MAYNKHIFLYTSSQSVLTSHYILKKAFAEENHLSENIVLVDGEQLIPEYFHANFKQWDGGSIPFTLLRKGDKTDETVGMMSKEMLDEKISSFMVSK